MRYRCFSVILLPMMTAALRAIGLEVICAPRQVRPSSFFHINVAYDIREPLRADLHFDFLDETTKMWLAGETIRLPSYQGNISIGMQLPPDKTPPVYIWKVYLSPHNEVFPNMLAEKGLAILIGDENDAGCPMLPPPLPSDSYDARGVDYLILDHLESRTDSRCRISIGLHYQLRTREEAFLSIVLMKRTNEIYAADPIRPIHQNDKNTTLHLDLDFPLPFSNQSLYLEASLLPSATSTWEDRLAEDRMYHHVCTTV